jgi:predicted nucleic acid-binding protein
MNGFLLDTNVASEARKGRRADPGVSAWLASAEDTDLFLSVLVLGEIRDGIERARPHDPVKARALELWLAGLERNFSGRTFAVTASVADQWGRLNAIRPIPTVDGLLAATALVHSLTLVTRNVADVAHTGVQVLNPFST